MTLVAVIVVMVVLMFVLGFVAPRKSQRAQAVRDRLLLRGESKGERNAGKAGDAASGALEATRKAGDAAARAGRKSHEKVTPG